MVSLRSGLVERMATGAPDQFLDTAHIFDRLARQIDPGTGARGRLRPAFEGFKDGLDAGLAAFARRQMVDLAPVELVADADLDLLEAVENVELGERDAVDAARLDRLAHKNRIEPAAAALASGDDAELAALLADAGADLVMKLGREGAFAHACRISLSDAEHIIDGAGAEPRSRGGGPGDRRGRGDEWIGAVIDVEKRALRALEENAPSGPACLVEKAPDGVHIGQHSGRERAQRRAHRLSLDFLHAEAAPQRVVMGQQALDFGRRAYRARQGP